MAHLFAIPIIKTTRKTTEIDASGNAQPTCVVLNSGDLPEDGPAYQFLGKILAAVDVSLEKDTLLLQNVTQEKAPQFIQFKSEIRPCPVLCFGILPEVLNLHMNPLPFRAFRFLEFDWIFSDSLDVLEKDVKKKKLLWEAMKVLFHKERK